MSFVVSDTTPLNYLILIGRIEVLPQLFGKLLVPPAVAHWADNLPEWVEVKAPAASLSLGIGLGESQAISLALELGDAAVLIDDKKARAIAENRGLLAIGTIAILDLADESGLLDFEDAISQLQTTSFHVEDPILQRVLLRVRARKGQ